MKEEVEFFPEEQILFSNKVGTITDKRIAIYQGLNRYKGRLRQDFLKNEITSISYFVDRHVGKGIFLILFGIIFSILVFGVFMIINGVRCICGRPTITVKSMDKDSIVIVGNPNKKKAAESFINQARQSMLQ
jgi:hypothetical protein